MHAAILDEHPRPIRQASPPAPAPSPDLDPAAPMADDEPGARALANAAMSQKIRELPKDVGVMLVAVGACGMVLPGMVGGPAMIAGGLVLWPSAFGRVESWFGRTFPKAHREGMRQIGRYIDDLDRRYSHTRGDSTDVTPVEPQAPRSEPS